MVIGKEFCTIVGDGSTQAEVSARVKQIRNLAEATEQDYEREKLNERIARLSGGVAIIQASRGVKVLGAWWAPLACFKARTLGAGSGRQGSRSAGRLAPHPAPNPAPPSSPSTPTAPDRPDRPRQVGAQTETELKEKKLRVEDALNATKAAVEEGERRVGGGGEAG